VITNNKGLELVKDYFDKESTYQVGEEQGNCYTFPRKWTLLFAILWTKQYYYLVKLKYFKHN
jgi:hypothetical protein